MINKGIKKLLDNSFVLRYHNKISKYLGNEWNSNYSRNVREIIILGREYKFEDSENHP